MADQERQHVEFHDAPQVRHTDISANNDGVITHRRIALYDAFHDVETAAPMLVLVVPHETLTHEAFTMPTGFSTVKKMSLRETQPSSDDIVT